MELFNSINVWAYILSSIKKWICKEARLIIVLGKIIKRLKKQNFELVAAVLRRIWLRRNIYMLEKKIESPSNLIRSTQEGLEEYPLVQGEMVNTIRPEARYHR